MTADNEWVADVAHKIPVSHIVMMENENKDLEGKKEIMIHHCESPFHLNSFVSQ